MGINERSNAAAGLVPGSSPVRGETMRAAVPHWDGPPSGLMPSAIEMPLPGRSDVLVRVGAAAVPTSALKAWQALGRIANVQPGQTVLDAGVTGVCSTRNVDLVRSLGADHVIDDTRTDSTPAERLYGVILAPRSTRHGTRSLGFSRQRMRPFLSATSEPATPGGRS